MSTRKERQLEKLHRYLSHARSKRDQYEMERDELRHEMKIVQENYEFHQVQVEDLEDLIRKVEEGD